MKQLLIGIVSVFTLIPAAIAATNMITVTGFGTVDPSMAQTKSQAKMLAKRAALLDAQRQLSEQVRGLEIRAGSTVEEYEVTSDIIATRVKTWLKGAVVVTDKIEEEDGTWVAQVELGVCLNNDTEICKGRDTLEAIANAVPVDSY